MQVTKFRMCAWQILVRNGESYGVEFVRNNTLTQVRARKEVLISAGAVGSPHLLMLSGIGPRRHLETFDVSLYTCNVYYLHVLRE